MKNINLLLPNPLLIYHEKFSPRIAVICQKNMLTMVPESFIVD